MKVKDYLSMRLPLTIREQLEAIGPDHLRGARANTARVMWALEQFVKSRKRAVPRETANEAVSSNP